MGEHAMSPRDLLTTNVNPNTLYDLGEMLGRGAYGAVWAGTDKQTKKKVAIKIMNFNEKDKKANDSLCAEIAILQKCKFVYLVALYTACLWESQIWLIMEQCDIGSLADLMRKATRVEIAISEDEVSSISQQTCAALGYLHKNGIIHRDIKAANILVKSDGFMKLADFGVSTVLDNTMHGHTAIGSPYWMSPELLVGESYDGRVDIWAFGITLIEIVEKGPPLGKHAPMRAMFLIASSDPPKLADPSAWTPEFVEVVHSCLKKDIQERPTPEELLGYKFNQRRECTQVTVAEWIAKVSEADLKRVEVETASLSSSKGTDPLLSLVEQEAEAKTPSSETASVEIEDRRVEVEDPMENIRAKLKTESQFITFVRAGDIKAEVPPSYSLLLTEIAMKMSNPLFGVGVRDRKKRLKKIEKAFVGREAVDWLYDNLDFSDRGFAVSLGRFLEASGFIEYASTSSSSEKKHFSDSSNSYYKFNQQIIDDWNKIYERTNAAKKENRLVAMKSRRHIVKKLHADILLTQKDWKVIQTACGSQKTFRTNDTILNEMNAKFIYLVIDGSVSVHKRNPKGGEIGERIALIQKDGVFNDSIILESQYVEDKIRDIPFAFKAASDQTTVCVIDPTPLRRLLLSEPGLSKRWYGTLAVRLAQLLRRVSSVVAEPENPEVSCLIKPPQAIPVQEHHRSGREQKFKKVFQVPESEELLRYYSATQKMYHIGIYISQHYFCFYGKIFGYLKKEVIPFDKIKNIAVANGELLVATSSSKYGFRDIDNLNEIHVMLDNLWSVSRPDREKEGQKLVRKSSNSSLNDTDQEETTDDEAQASAGLTKEDWDLLLGGFFGVTRLHFRRNDFIMKEGQNYNQIFQIAEGKCKIEKEIKETQSTDKYLSVSSSSTQSSLSSSTSSSVTTTSESSASEKEDKKEKRRSREKKHHHHHRHSGDKPKRGSSIETGGLSGSESSSRVAVLGEMTAGELFGEISFLEGTAASASVVAKTDQVSVYAMDGDFLSLMCLKQPSLSGRFYHHLCTVLSDRVKKRQFLLIEMSFKV